MTVGGFLRKQSSPVESPRCGSKAHSGTGPIRDTAVAAAPVKSLHLPPQMGQGSKIKVSTSLQMTTVGPVNWVALSYDNRGVLNLKQNNDATKVFQQYNKVEIVVDPARIPPHPLSTEGNRQPQKTAADLDAEMEDYQKAKE
ncbi:hypothetical protein BY996DRAFT_6435570 [Phakopsora pachyrhizi]|nr:hypothetical protein BY996DRAFT_6435570 [Phakopsora pachyrhizi]